MQRRSAGAALISALLIMAIAAVIAVTLAVKTHVLIHAGRTILDSDQAYLNLQRVQLWEEASLKQFPKQTVGGETLTGRIEDEQGKFNVNDLRDSKTNHILWHCYVYLCLVFLNQNHFLLQK